MVKQLIHVDAQGTDSEQTFLQCIIQHEEIRIQDLAALFDPLLQHRAFPHHVPL